jgi:hypothetical protein
MGHLDRIFFLYFVLGAGLLLPWNVILNCIPSFKASFPAPPAGAAAPYFAPSRYAFFAPLAFNSPQLPAQVLQLLFGEATPLHLRLYAGFGVQAALMVLLPFAVPLGMAPVLVGCVAAGAATAVIESALFGAAGMLGGEAGAVGVRAILVGEGAAAVLSSLVQLALHADPALGESQWAVRAYFLVAAAVMVACLALLPRALALKGGAAAAKDGGDGAAAVLLEMSETAPLLGQAKGSAGKAAGGSEEGGSSDPLDPIGAPAAGAPEAEADAGAGAGAGAAPASPLSLTLLTATWPTTLAIFLAMFLSFLVFPGCISDIAYEGGPRDFFTRDPASWSLLLFLLFNGGDLVGRWAAGLSCLGLGRAWSLRTQALATAAYNVARAVFLPLFYVASRPGGTLRVPGGSAALALAVLAFAVTNGHAATLAMVVGPQLVGASQRQQVATLHVLCLIAGLWAGAAAGLSFAPSAE